MTEDFGIKQLRLCYPKPMQTEVIYQCNSSIFLYPPQSSCSLLLVDVDEVAHHTALDHTSLSLHADLEGQTEGIFINIKLETKHAQPVWNAVGSTSQVRGCINRAPVGMQIS